MNTKTIYFYEMSKIDGTPYVISNVDTFYGFCSHYGIKLTTANKNFINRNSTVYAICKQGKAELVLSGDYKNLKKNFSKSHKK